jgi:methionyl aminopeptidase
VKYTETDYENLRQSGKILRDCLKMLESKLCAGMTTLELDKLADEFITARGGSACFKYVENYNHAICTSVNYESVHGMPRKDKILRSGDIISIDCGVRFPKVGGMCTDAARTVGVGEINPEAKTLIEVTKKCFEVGTKGIKNGTKVGEIGAKIGVFVANLVQKTGVKYGIVDTYFGHGIGKSVHENPLIPNFNVSTYKKPLAKKIIDFSNHTLSTGDIICVEPMINAGTEELKTARDGWTAVTVDGELAAHHENTIIIWENGFEIVT